MQRIMGAVYAAFALMAAGVAIAQEAKTTEPAPEQEIRRLLKDVEEGFNRGDAKALASCWTPTGDFVNHTGVRVEGRDAIEKGFQESLSTHKGGKLQLVVVASRLVNPGLALVDAIADVKAAGTSVPGTPSFNFVLLKSGDRWLIESARETIAHVASQAQHLKALDWMVGDWAEASAPKSGIALHGTCGWTDNKAFLIRKFSVEGTSGALHSGTEVIGWDPRAQIIRSWVFDSNGGFGENTWIEDGNRWLIKYSGTLADGSDVSATNVVTLVDANTITLLSKDRTVNSVPQPGTPEITLKRQPVSADTTKPLPRESDKPKEPKKLSQRVLP